MTSVSPDNFSTADPYVGRSAPWSQEAEQAVLAAMLLDQDAALRAAELVDDGMFYREGHRRLIEAGTSIITEAYDGHSTAVDLLDVAESKIFQISQQRGNDGFTRIKEMLWPTMERIETLQRSGKAITGVPSGFLDLDGLTSGFQRAELVVVAARPSMGKTAFCLNIAANAAAEGQGVVIFSLELS